MFRPFIVLMFVALTTAACADNNAVATTDVKDEALVVATASASDIKTEAELREKLQRIRPDLQLASVTDSELEGFYFGKIANGPEVYIAKNGSHLLVGDVYELADNGLVDLKEKRFSSVRQEVATQLNPAEQIIFKPEGEVKAVINVFTDVDCGYCQKLHYEMANYNAAGIEVRYLAYPRAGIGSPAYKKIASAWCANNPNDALTALKNRQEIPENVCDGNPVADQYALGGKIGVRGTPAILLEDGRLLPGYRDAKTLAVELGI